MAKTKKLNLPNLPKMGSTIYLIETREYDHSTHNTEIWIEKHKIMGQGQYAHGGYFWINENEEVVQSYDCDVFYNTLTEAKEAALALYRECKEYKTTCHINMCKEYGRPYYTDGGPYHYGGILSENEICFKPQDEDTWWICPTKATKRKYNILG